MGEEVKKVEEVKKKEKNRKGKHSEKTSLGDIVFRVLIIVAIFFIALLAYAFYIQ